MSIAFTASADNRRIEALMLLAIAQEAQKRASSSSYCLSITLSQIGFKVLRTISNNPIKQHNIRHQSPCHCRSYSCSQHSPRISTPPSAPLAGLPFPSESFPSKFSSSRWAQNLERRAFESAGASNYGEESFEICCLPSVLHCLPEISVAIYPGDTEFTLANLTHSTDNDLHKWMTPAFAALYAD